MLGARTADRSADSLVARFRCLQHPCYQLQYSPRGPLMVADNASHADVFLAMLNLVHSILFASLDSYHD
jgi:hypothetical protein